MKLFQKKSILTMMMSLGLVLTACGNQAGSSASDDNASQTQTNSQPVKNSDSNSDKGASKDLKQYSKDPDKNDPSEGDFDIVGKLVSETDGELILNIKGDKITIQKKSSFDKDMKGFKRDLKGKMVDVEISTKNQKAESLKPTRQTRADQDGVFKKEDDGKKLVGKLVSDKKNEITVHVKSGDKTYQKSEDFEMDKSAKKDKINGKVVQLDIDEHGKAEKLKYSWADQA
ncbi:hypothetical protein ACFSMW_08095 [Virgibacillus halophilus]|uniref:hypothetical protein n=1 Tax=Tigheibacillus halophilus TaxID=361280 RepID=UPI003640E328